MHCLKILLNNWFGGSQKQLPLLHIWVSTETHSYRIEINIIIDVLQIISTLCFSFSYQNISNLKKAFLLFK